MCYQGVEIVDYLCFGILSLKKKKCHKCSFKVTLLLCESLS